ncbi:hypothetical protein WUBG_04153, partial [Wuchereria bancrofti]
MVLYPDFQGDNGRSGHVCNCTDYCKAEKCFKPSFGYDNFILDSKRFFRTYSVPLELFLHMSR